MEDPVFDCYCASIYTSKNYTYGFYHQRLSFESVFISAHKQISLILLENIRCLECNLLNMIMGCVSHMRILN